jgi:hypothetical protein
MALSIIDRAGLPGAVPRAWAKQSKKMALFSKRRDQVSIISGFFALRGEFGLFKSL